MSFWYDALCVHTRHWPCVIFPVAFRLFCVQMIPIFAILYLLTCLTFNLASIPPTTGSAVITLLLIPANAAQTKFIVISTKKDTFHVVSMHLKEGYTFFSSNLWSKFSQCYYIVTSECHISPESLCHELSKFKHYFDLVAMATLLALWLAKHGNGCNSKTKHRMLTIHGW